MFVLILCMFKVGSCFLEKCLADNDVKHVKLHSYDFDEQILHPMDKITHVITIFREKKQVYMSAFFEDIDKIDQYEYAFGTQEEIENASIDDLINHFNMQDWSKFRWLNFKYYADWIKFFKRQGKKTLKLNCNQLSIDVNEKLPQFLGKTTMTIDLNPSHVGIEGKFGNKYSNFLNCCSNR